MEVEELKKLLLAEQQGRMKAEEEKQKMEEEKRKMEEEKQKLEEEKQKLKEEIQGSTLTEYLRLCHEHLSESISVQTDKSLSTKGDPSNADGKLRPDYLQPWKDFIDTQKETLKTLYSTYPASDDMPRVFDSSHSIKTQGEKVALRKLASEQDLQNLQYNIVETPVTQIVQHLKSLDGASDKFGLAGGIEFYNHMNPLSDDRSTARGTTGRAAYIPSPSRFNLCLHDDRGPQQASHGCRIQSPP